MVLRVYKSRALQGFSFTDVVFRATNVAIGTQHVIIRTCIIVVQKTVWIGSDGIACDVLKAVFVIRADICECVLGLLE